MAGSPSLDGIPPELFCQITDCLTSNKDVQSLALASKSLRVSCAPALYRQVSYGSSVWRDLFEHPAEGLPTWSRHVHVLAFLKLDYKSPPIDFRSLVPVLESLKGLNKIEVTSGSAKIARDSGVDELSQRVPSLRTFIWKPFIDIEKVGELSLRNLEELDLSLESGPEATQRTPLPPHDSPLNSLAALSESHPHLRRLSLRLNYPVTRRGSRILRPAPSNPVLSNVFPNLVHFSLKGLLGLPTRPTFHSFVAAHASLRSFTCHVFDDSLSLPSEAFPNLEYLEGSVALLAAVCDASASPRCTLVEICGVPASRPGDVPDTYATRVFPKLPRLTKAIINNDQYVTPEWLESFGEHCPELVTLSLHDPNWVGSNDDLARAFSAFKHLSYLSTSKHFAQIDRTGPRRYRRTDSDDALPVAVACNAPCLTRISWGDEARVVQCTGPPPVSYRLVHRDGNAVTLVKPVTRADYAPFVSM